MSLACSLSGHSIAAGTEFSNHQASILIWDARAGSAPRIQYNEVHSDDVTEVRRLLIPLLREHTIVLLSLQLNYHPSSPNVLLSGSTDGLVNVYDTTITDEDEVVIQTFNHGSIHHAGFLNDTEVYATSHDEKFALYDMAETQEKGSATVDFGDIREVLRCQYVANVTPKLGDSGAVIGAGSQE